jgi:superoxide dismutase, Fe-Mn family
MKDNRRDFIKKSALLGLGTIASNLVANTFSVAGSGSRFPASDLTLPPLPYAYDALEPYIDKETMKLHHSKHHQGYIDKLASAPASDFNKDLDLAESCGKVTGSTSMLVRNNLGGHYNHSLFWQLLRPAQTGKENAPGGSLSEALIKSFGPYDNFKKEFSDKALKIFGSGWCWLVKDDKGNLKIVTTPNQDNPLMQVTAERGKPVLALDVWEHAYYLKYQNKRADYISAWWNIVNWEKAAELYNH